MGWPHAVIYTNRLPSGVAGRANGPLIRIRKNYRADMGLHAHEYEHVRQWYVTLGLHSVLYLTSRRYRQWSEARAYAEQVRRGASLAAMAKRLCAKRYRLNITEERAEALILKHI